MVMTVGAGPAAAVFGVAILVASVLTAGAPDVRRLTAAAAGE
jgi:hypothetical protein